MITNHKITLVFGLALLLFCSGCSKSPAAVVKQNQTELNLLLNNLSAVGHKAAQEKLSSDQVTLPPAAPPFELDDIGDYAYAGRSNAQMFLDHDLSEPYDSKFVGYLSGARKDWQAVQAMVHEGRFPDSDDQARELLQRFLNWRYAVVIRTRSLEEPQIAGELRETNVTDAGTYSQGGFVGGEINGDVLVYDLRDLSFLGGFRIEAHNSATVGTTTFGGVSAAEALRLEMNRDLKEQVKKLVFDGLRARLPEARTYMNGNLRARVMTESGAR